MFIKIGDEGVLVNAMHINSIRPIQVDEKLENGNVHTHYGVKLSGAIEPENSMFYYEDEKTRDAFLEEITASNMVISNTESGRAASHTKYPAAPATAKKKR